MALDCAVTANTTVSILRGTTVDDFGDELDNETVAASGIPAAIFEESPTAKSEASKTERLIRRFLIRIPRNTVVFSGDRLGDERSGEIFLVDKIKRPRRAAISGWLLVFGKYVDSVTVPVWPSGFSFNPFTNYCVHTEAGPTLGFPITHNIGRACHVSVFVGGIEFTANVTQLPDALAPTSTVIGFDEPQSNVLVVISI